MCKSRQTVLSIRAENLVGASMRDNPYLSRKKQHKAALSMIAHCQRFRGQPATGTVYHEVGEAEWMAMYHAYEEVYGKP